MGRRRAWALLAAIALSGCASKNVAERATSSQPIRFASATFYCSHKLPEGAQLAKECVYQDKLEQTYKELAALHVLFEDYQRSKQ